MIKVERARGPWIRENSAAIILIQQIEDVLVEYCSWEGERLRIFVASMITEHKHSKKQCKITYQISKLVFMFRLPSLLKTGPHRYTHAIQICTATWL